MPDSRGRRRVSSRSAPRPFRRTTVGADGEDLARLALRAALEGDPLAVGRPVGVLVDIPDGRIGELLSSLPSMSIVKIAPCVCASSRNRLKAIRPSGSSAFAATVGSDVALAF